MKIYLNWAGTNCQIIIEDDNNEEIFVSEMIPESQLIESLKNKTLQTEDEQEKQLGGKK